MLSATTPSLAFSLSAAPGTAVGSIAAGSLGTAGAELALFSATAASGNGSLASGGGAPTAGTTLNGKLSAAPPRVTNELENVFIDPATGTAHKLALALAFALPFQPEVPMASILQFTGASANASHLTTGLLTTS